MKYEAQWLTGDFLREDTTKTKFADRLRRGVGTQRVGTRKGGTSRRSLPDSLLRRRFSARIGAVLAGAPGVRRRLVVVVQSTISE